MIVPYSVKLYLISNCRVVLMSWWHGLFVVYDFTILCITLIDMLFLCGPHGGMGCFVGMIVPYPVLI